MRKLLTYLIIICHICLASDTHAQQESLRVSGFGTFGMAYTDAEYYRFRSDISRNNQFSDDKHDLNALNHLGLHFEYSFNQDFDLVAQFVYRGQDELSLDNYTSLAFVRYQPNANWKIRAGRTALDLFLLTEYRDISFAYPWAKVPNEVYGLIPYRSIDGGDLQYHNYFNDYNYRIKLFTGQSDADIAFTDGDTPLAITNVIGMSLELGHLDWLVSLKHTQAELDNEIGSALVVTQALNQIPSALWPSKNQFLNEFAIKGKRAYYTSLGAHYTLGNIELMAEAVHLDGDAIPIQKVTSGYISLAYHLNKHQIYALYATANSDSYLFDDLENVLPVLPIQTPFIIQGVNEANGFFAPNQSTYSLGWRFDLEENLALKFQYERNHVEQGGGTLWQYQQSVLNSPTEDFNTFFVTVSFTF